MQLAIKVIVMNTKYSMNNAVKYTLVLSVLFLSACSSVKEKPSKSESEPSNKSGTERRAYAQRPPQQERNGSTPQGATTDNISSTPQGDKADNLSSYLKDFKSDSTGFYLKDSLIILIAK